MLVVVDSISQAKVLPIERGGATAVAYGKGHVVQVHRAMIAAGVTIVPASRYRARPSGWRRADDWCDQRMQRSPRTKERLSHGPEEVPGKNRVPLNVRRD